MESYMAKIKSGIMTQGTGGKKRLNMGGGQKNINQNQHTQINLYVSDNRMYVL